MSLAGPHDRLPSFPTAAPGPATGSPRSPISRPAPAANWPPSSPGEPTTPGRQAIVRHARPPRNRSVQQRLPEIDTGRTLIARSSTGSVGPGGRIGSVQAPGEHQQPWRTERNRIPVWARRRSHAGARACRPYRRPCACSSISVVAPGGAGSRWQPLTLTAGRYTWNEWGQPGHVRPVCPLQSGRSAGRKVRVRQAHGWRATAGGGAPRVGVALSRGSGEWGVP
jgi:hypothetical protein